MKKLFLLSIAISSYGLAFSQNGNVGIGTTTPNADAKLDITATNKGLLLPRVALTGTANAAPLSAHVAGMTVYNTKDTLDVTKGTYYNNGIKWIKIGDAATAWSLTGNAGTTPGTNYLGTKDSTALVFKTNATNDTSRKMVIMPNGYVGIGTLSPKSIFAIEYDHDSRIGYGDDISISRYAGTYAGIWAGGLMTIYSRGTKAAPLPSANGDANGGFSFLFKTKPAYAAYHITPRYMGDSTTDLTSLEFANSKGSIYFSENAQIGIGTITPQAKLEINSGVTNSSGLKFSQMNSSTPAATTGALLGVDNNGNVTTISKGLTSGRIVSTVPNYTIIADGQMLDIVSFTLPEAGTWLIMYSARADISSTTNAWATAHLANSDNTVLPNSEIMITEGNNTTADATGSGTYLITTTTSTTYKLRLRANQGSAIAWNDENGRSAVTYVKLGIQ